MNGEHPNTREAPTTDRRVMDPELKAKWLEALRSGKYPQGAGQLHSSEGYCCLGVLCNIYDPKGWGEDYEWTYGTGEDIDSEVGNLPFVFRTSIGISDDAETALIRLNDSEGQNFAQIADWIEKNL